MQYRSYKFARVAMFTLLSCCNAYGSGLHYGYSGNRGNQEVVRVYRQQNANNQTNLIQAQINTNHSEKCKDYLNRFATGLKKAIIQDVQQISLRDTINFISICSDKTNGQKDSDEYFADYLKNYDMDIDIVSSMYNPSNPFAYLNNKIHNIHKNNQGVNVIIFDEMFFCRHSYFYVNDVIKIRNWIGYLSVRYPNSVFIVNNVFCEDIPRDKDYIGELTRYKNYLSDDKNDNKISSSIHRNIAASQINGLIADYKKDTTSRKNLKVIKNQSEIIHNGKLLITKLKGSYCREGGDIIYENYKDILYQGSDDFFMYQFGDGYSAQISDTKVANLFMQSFYLDICFDDHVGIGKSVNFYQYKPNNTNIINPGLCIYCLHSNIIFMMRLDCLSNLPKYFIPILHIDKYYGDDVECYGQQCDYNKKMRLFCKKAKSITRNDTADSKIVEVNRYNFGNYVDQIILNNGAINIANKQNNNEQKDTVTYDAGVDNDARQYNKQSVSVFSKITSGVWSGLKNLFSRKSIKTTNKQQKAIRYNDNQRYYNPLDANEYTDSLKPMDFLVIDDKGVNDVFKTIIASYNFNNRQ